MKKEMIYMPMKEFILANLDFNIATNRKDSEYDFNFTRWKTLIFSSQKLKFVLKYTQSVLQWLSKVVDVTNFNISIDTTTVDRFNLSIYEFDTHVFNCTLFTNFYLIPEGDWSKKIFEMHYSKFDIQNSEPKTSELTAFWKGEEGFEKFVNMLYGIIKEPYKFEKLFPIQWQIDFKDKKLSSSQIRMQIASINHAREQIAHSQAQEVINPIWDESIEQENAYSDLSYAMKKIRGIENPNGNKKRRR
jgi:hypothetical protein